MHNNKPRSRNKEQRKLPEDIELTPEQLECLFWEAITNKGLTMEELLQNIQDEGGLRELIDWVIEEPDYWRDWLKNN